MLERSLGKRNQEFQDSALLYQKRERQHGKDAWLIYESTIFDYERQFQGLFPDQVKKRSGGITQFIEQRRLQQRPVVALDLMSDGHVFRQWEADAALAVNLFDHRTDREKTIDTKDNHLEVVTGSIAIKPTWQAIDNWLKLHSPERGQFDLIMMRGGGPIEDIPSEPKLLYIYLQRLWDRLSPQDGLLLTQIPKEGLTVTEDWAHHVATLGLDAQFHADKVRDIQLNPVLKLMRHPNDPEQLPQL